jgi:hypothetical protein
MFLDFWMASLALYLCYLHPHAFPDMAATFLMGFEMILLLKKTMKLTVNPWQYRNSVLSHSWMMGNDFDPTGHPTDQLLDPEKTNNTVVLIRMIFPDLLCIYPSALVQEFPSKSEMNQSIMVQSCFELTQNFPQALIFLLKFEN